MFQWIICSTPLPQNNQFCAHQQHTWECKSCGSADMKVHSFSARIPESSPDRGGMLSRKVMKMVAQSALKVHDIQPRTRSQTNGIECTLLVLQVTDLQMGSAAWLMLPVAYISLSSISLHPTGRSFIKLLIALWLWHSALSSNFCPSPRKKTKNTPSAQGKSLSASSQAGSEKYGQELL